MLPPYRVREEYLKPMVRLRPIPTVARLKFKIQKENKIVTVYRPYIKKAIRFFIFRIAY